MAARTDSPERETVGTTGEEGAHGDVSTSAGSKLAAPETEPVVKPATKLAKRKKEEPAPVQQAARESLSLSADEIDKPKVVKAKGSKNIHSGIAHVLSTFNNTIVTITDMKGNVIGWSSAGKVGFKGSRKSTAYAAQMVAQDASRQAMGHGLKEVEVLVKGPGQDANRRYELCRQSGSISRLFAMLLPCHITAVARQNNAASDALNSQLTTFNF